MSARKDRHIADEVGDGANHSDGAAGGPGPTPDSCHLQNANAPPWGRAGTKWAEEKRQRILAAAIQEFAEKGYVRSSTNAIVAKAGIAKGLLFHYFGSKKELYLAALDHCLDEAVDYFLRHLENLPSDLLDRLIRWGSLKVQMLSERPDLYRLSLSLTSNPPEGLRAELESRRSKLTSQLMPVFLKGIDFSSLRPGVDPKKAVELVLWVSNGVAEKYLAVIRNHPDQGLAALTAAMREMEEYVGMLRHGLYR